MVLSWRYLTPKTVAAYFLTSANGRFSESWKQIVLSNLCIALQYHTSYFRSYHHLCLQSLDAFPFVASDCLKVLQVQVLSIVLFKVGHDFGVGDVGLSDFRSILHSLHDQVHIPEMVYCHVPTVAHASPPAVHGCFILRACESDVRAIVFASRGCLSVCCVPFYQCSM